MYLYYFFGKYVACNIKLLFANCMVDVKSHICDAYLYFTENSNFFEQLKQNIKQHLSNTVYKVDGGYLIKKHYIDFFVDENLDIMIINIKKTNSEIDLMSYITYSIIPMWLNIKKELQLHCSIVTLNNQTTCFIGESRSGKTTIAYKSLCNGGSIICDDHTRIFKDDTGKIKASLSYPYIKLYDKFYNENIGMYINKCSDEKGKIWVGIDHYCYKDYNIDRFIILNKNDQLNENIVHKKINHNEALEYLINNIYINQIFETRIKNVELLKYIVKKIDFELIEYLNFDSIYDYIYR